MHSKTVRADQKKISDFIFSEKYKIYLTEAKG